MRNLVRREDFDPAKCPQRLRHLTFGVASATLHDLMQYAEREPSSIFGQPVGDVLQARFETDRRTVVIFGSTVEKGQYPQIDAATHACLQTLLSQRVNICTGGGPGFAMRDTLVAYDKMAREDGIEDALTWQVLLAIREETPEVCVPGIDARTARGTNDPGVRRLQLLLADAALSLHMGIGTVDEVAGVGLAAKHLHNQQLALPLIEHLAMFNCRAVPGDRSSERIQEWMAQIARVNDAIGRRYLNQLMKKWQIRDLDDAVADEIGHEVGRWMLNRLKRTQRQFHATRTCVLNGVRIGRAIFSGELPPREMMAQCQRAISEFVSA